MVVEGILVAPVWTLLVDGVKLVQLLLEVGVGPVESKKASFATKLHDCRPTQDELIFPLVYW